MIKMQIVSITNDQTGVKLSLLDPDGIAGRFEVHCPKMKSEHTPTVARARLEALHDWALGRALGDTIELAVPWDTIGEESTP